jgi:long-chain acyl-CoA synthetase
MIDKIIQRFPTNAGCAVSFNGGEATYPFLYERINHWTAKFQEADINQGDVVAVEGDFSPESIAIFWALTQQKSIIVPIVRGGQEELKATFFEVAAVKQHIFVDEFENVEITELNPTDKPVLYEKLVSDKKPGLVLFSSGTSGVPKAAVHDFSMLLEKFVEPGKCARMINFLLFDHWGGINTMLHILSSGGELISTKNRRPDNICKIIMDKKVEILPTSPSFLNLLIISRAYKEYDLSSLKMITYGTEPMPESTLVRLKEIFPDVKLKQTYGLIELGVFKTQSESSESLWFKLDRKECDWRIVDKLLELKSRSPMLGYINAESPFTEDGWFKTGDMVEVNGEYLKVLGRQSEVINVGGEKVYPVEVEDVIQQMDNVESVTVYKEKHPLMGSLVCAKVKLTEEMSSRDFTKSLKVFCKGRLAKYKIPVKVVISDESEMSYRMKKTRFKVDS